MSNRINKYKYPGAKRLMLEAQELRDKTEDYCAQPIDDNLFEWHFTVRGPPDTAFEGGFYHGRLSFPTEYPMKPPFIILLNPNGRFETNKKICLSISGFHPETWQPSWSVRTALLALIAFMPTKGNRAIGSLDYSDPERRKLAKHSRTWRCETCGLIRDLLKHPENPADTINSQQAEEAGTSRIEDSGLNSRSDGSQDDKSSSSDRSDSDGETRDSSTDSQRSASSSDISDTNDGASTDNLRQERTLDIHDVDGLRLDDGASSVSNQEVVISSELQRSTCEILSGSNVVPTTINISRSDGRRPFPPLLFVSISILLLLLILRRVVMIIQS